MNQFGPFVVLIAISAVILAGLGALYAWWNEESRRIRRGLRKVLGEAPHAVLVAPGRGRGAGFNFASNTMAVTWDCGGWCLIYKIDELVGVELVIDGQVAARSWRGEVRRPLENTTAAEKSVALRLVFDDAQHPDYVLELWAPQDAALRPATTPAQAIEEGNRWLARTESLFRRRPAPVSARMARALEPAAEPAPSPAAQPPPLRQELPFEEAPPWEDGDEDGDQALSARPV